MSGASNKAHFSNNPLAGDKAERGTFVFVKDKDTGESKLVNIADYRSPEPEPSNHHSVISDEMEPTLNHVDNKVYTSKAKFREVYKAVGAIEVGNEKVDWDERRRCEIAKLETVQETIQRQMERYQTSSSYREELRQRKENHDL